MSSSFTLSLQEESSWGDFVKSYIDLNSTHAECILKYGDKFLGVDVPLIYEIEHCKALEVTAVSPQFSSKPYYYRIKYAYNAYIKNLSWPLWEQDKLCPINKHPLGCWNKKSKYEVVPLVRDNRPENLIILTYAHSRKIVNKFAYYAKVIMNDNIDPFTKDEIDPLILNIISTGSYEDFNDLTIIDMRPGTPNELDNSYSCEDVKTLFNVAT